jgi:hypothetical protein
MPSSHGKLSKQLRKWLMVADERNGGWFIEPIFGHYTTKRPFSSHLQMSMAKVGDMKMELFPSMGGTTVPG